MPKCPNCGGTSAREIAPGYYQCTSSDSEGESCTNRYQVGTGSHNNLCQCGTLAVGRCVKCGRWVCGEHSSLYGGERICDVDRDKERQEEIENERQQLESLRLSAQRFAKAMRGVGNPGSRTFLPPLDSSQETKLRGWALGYSYSVADVQWYVVLTDGSLHFAFRQRSSKFDLTKYSTELKDVRISSELNNLKGEVLHILNQEEDEPQPLVTGILDRLDALCVEHGLEPVSRK